MSVPSLRTVPFLAGFLSLYTDTGIEAISLKTKSISSNSFLERADTVASSSLRKLLGGDAQAPADNEGSEEFNIARDPTSKGPKIGGDLLNYRMRLKCFKFIGFHEFESKMPNGIIGICGLRILISHRMQTSPNLATKPPQ